MSKNAERSRMTWAQAVRDCTVHSMNKGQLPLFACASIIAIIFWRLPPERLADIVKDSLFKALVVSVVLNVVLAACWAIHCRWVRRSQAAELDRIGVEKSQLQEQIADRKLSSSAKTKR